MHLLNENIKFYVIPGLVICDWHFYSCIPDRLVLIFLCCIVCA